MYKLKSLASTPSSLLMPLPSESSHIARMALIVELRVSATATRATKAFKVHPFLRFIQFGYKIWLPTARCFGTVW